MRQTVKEQNIYRWAANLIAELCEVRLESTDKTQERTAPEKVTVRATNPPSVA
jgi:hypothetical protein